MAEQTQKSFPLFYSQNISAHLTREITLEKNQTTVKFSGYLTFKNLNQLSKSNSIVHVAKHGDS